MNTVACKRSMTKASVCPSVRTMSSLSLVYFYAVRFFSYCFFSFYFFYFTLRKTREGCL